MKSCFTANPTSYGAKIYGTQLAFHTVRSSIHFRWMKLNPARIYGGIRGVEMLG